jgi:hypothetical protein
LAKLVAERKAGTTTPTLGPAGQLGNPESNDFRDVEVVVVDFLSLCAG